MHLCSNDTNVEVGRKEMDIEVVEQMGTLTIGQDVLQKSQSLTHHEGCGLG
jgi:hypothetical protein